MSIRLFFLLDILLLVLDWQLIYALRRIQFDFLIGARNRKSAYRIHAEQSPKDRFTLSYIQHQIKRDKYAFSFYQRCYFIELITLIPQYVLVFLSHGFFGMNSRYVLYVLNGIKLLAFFAVRLQMDGNWVSRYAKKPHQR